MAGKALGAGEGEAGQVWGGNGQITRHGAYEVWHGGHYGVVRQGGGLRGVFAIGAAGGKAEQQTVQRCVEAAIHHGALALRWDCGRCLCCAEGAKHLTADPFANLRASGLRLSGTSS